jgi:hypothetical protein
MSTSTWQRSTYCAEGSNCVEIRAVDGAGGLQVRESTAPEALLTVEPARLGALLRAIRAGSHPGTRD